MPAYTLALHAMIHLSSQLMDPPQIEAARLVRCWIVFCNRQLQAETPFPQSPIILSKREYTMLPGFATTEIWEPAADSAGFAEFCRQAFHPPRCAPARLVSRIYVRRATNGKRPVRGVCLRSAKSGVCAGRMITGAMTNQRMVAASALPTGSIHLRGEVSMRHGDRRADGLFGFARTEPHDISRLGMSA